jgi:hypothetical protein
MPRIAQETDIYLVVAAHLDTVADTPNATVGEGDTVYSAVLLTSGTAEESLVIATVVGLLDRLDRLGSLGRSRRRRRNEFGSWASKSTSGDGEDGEDGSGKLHVVGLESVGLEKRVLKCRMESEM